MATESPRNLNFGIDSLEMPRTEVHFYRSAKGEAPVLDWLKDLRAQDRRAYAKCVARIFRLRELGYQLRRPEADFLQAGIYELRIRHERVNYRLLYFFHGQNVAILAHSITKEGRVPEVEIERALRRKRELETNPDQHIYEQEVNDEQKKP